MCFFVCFFKYTGSGLKGHLAHRNPGHVSGRPLQYDFRMYGTLTQTRKHFENYTGMYSVVCMTVLLVTAELDVKMQILKQV